LLPVAGRPVIDYVIDNLAACRDIDEIYVAVSHNASVIEKYLEHAKRPGLEITVVRTLGWETGGDLQTVIIDRNLKEQVVVCYGDNVTRLDLGKLVAAHKRNRLPNATVLLFNVPEADVSRFGIAEVDGNKITRFVEKPPIGTTTSRLANAGYFIIEPEALAQAHISRFKLESTYFPKWAEEGKLYGHIQDVKVWIDIGTMEAYQSVNKLVDKILSPPEMVQK